jgi:hypothetical protein
MKCVDNIEDLLSSVLRWLENVDEDEKWWQLQTKVVQLCLLELDQPFQSEAACSPAMIQGVRDMVEAMQRRNRPAAIESAKVALGLVEPQEKPKGLSV